MAEEHTQEPHGIEEVLNGIEEISDGHEKVCIGDALDRFGHASFAPMLIILPLVELSPIGGIPGIPTMLAAIIALIAIQMLMGRDHVWLPDFVERRAVGGERLAAMAHKLDKVARRIDAVLGDRLDWITRGIWIRIAAFLIIALCATVPPLEIIPFASSLPMAAIAAFGLAILVRDGVLMLAGFLLSGGATYLVFATLLGGTSG